MGDGDKQVIEDKRIVLVSASDLKPIHTVAEDGGIHGITHPFLEGICLAS
jgi:hypothetical protein